MALVGALRRCPPLAVLALRRAGRLASHPARTTSISTIYSWWVLSATQFVQHLQIGSNMKLTPRWFTLALLASGAAQAGLTAIAQVPLLNIKGTGAVKPNLMMVYDNSGSMAFDFTPDVIAYNPSVATTGVCRANLLLSTAQRTCDNGDPPFSSPDLNKQYYNPDIRYTAPVDATGVPYSLSAYGNVSPWDKVRVDGFDGGSSTINLVTGFPDLKWCDPSNTNICFVNTVTYSFPDATYRSPVRTYTAPYYFRIGVAEYCTDATLTVCTTTTVGAPAPTGYPVPAAVRWCADTALTSKTCQAKLDKTHVYPRFSNPSTRYVSGYGTVTIGASATANAMKVNTITVTEGSAVITITNGAVTAAGGASVAATRAALANDVAASIIAKTGLNNQYTACVRTPSSGSSVPDCDQMGISLATDYVVAVIPLDCPAAGVAKSNCAPLADGSRANWVIGGNATAIAPTALLSVAGTSGSVFSIASAQLGTTPLFGSPATALTFSSGNKSNAVVAAAIQGRIGTVGTVTAYMAGNGVTPVCKAASGANVLCLVDTGSSTNGAVPAAGTLSNKGSIVITPTNGAGADTIPLAYTPLSGGNAIFVRTDIVKTRTTYPKDPQRTDCAAATSCTYAEEMSNFATWYTFYRTRNQMMKTAVGQAFAPLTSSYRVGLATLRDVNKDGSIAMIPATFTGADRASWYRLLYATTASGGTPMRNAVHKVGQMFATNAAVVTELCQPNFMLVTTDGYWNGGTTTDVTDNDKQEDANHFCTVAGGCVDSNSPNTNSNSLADVALYWYNGGSNGAPKSLIAGRTGLTAAMTENMAVDGTVPARAGENKHLHITTYTLGLGVDGIMTYDPDYDKAGTVGDFSKLLTGATGCPWNGGGKYVWPNVHSDDPNTDYQERVDDLWHAAVNGRGKYFTASVPAEVVAGITSALNNMQSVSGAASAAATSTPNISLNDNDIFSDTYTTVKWYGELSAQKIDINDGTVGTASTWNTSATIGTHVGPSADTRTIYMLDASAPRTLKPFKYQNMNSTETAWFDNRCSVLAQCTTLTDAQKVSANSGENLVNWLRGQQQYADDTIYRAYSSYQASPASTAVPIVLGDIASSKPAFARDPRKGYTIAGYAKFKADNTPPLVTARKAMVYTAANDGMLHAFDAATGEEQWAYAPRITMKKLAALASTNYSTNHVFTTDGSPELADVQIGGVWKTVLVAGLGGGGRGYYALDVTDPLHPGLLWEMCTDSALCSVSTPHLGLSYGNPQFGMWQGKWVVYLTSGYNNVKDVDGGTGGDGAGHLFIVDIASGALTDISNLSGDATLPTPTPSGLAKITAISANPATDPLTTYIYGGDNQGQMWRFDLTDATGKVVVVKMGDAGALKPITTRPDVSSCQVSSTSAGKTTTSTSRVVLFGTGRLLDVPDTTNADVQTLFLLKDKDGVAGNPISDIRGTTMVQQKLSVLDATHANSYLVSNKGVDLSTMNGWFLDWDINPRERLNLDPKIVNGGVNVVTNVTGVSSACSVGGSSNVYQVGLCTGSMPSASMIAGTTLSAGSAAVGFIIVRLPSGKLKMISTLATGDKLTTEVKPFNSMGARKVGWRRVQN
jgi:type IV pilus assembly protein PilY1